VSKRKLLTNDPILVTYWEKGKDDREAEIIEEIESNIGHGDQEGDVYLMDVIAIIKGEDK
jgi:hypothetical protein